MWSLTSMTFIYRHGFTVKTCGDEFELEGRNVAACRHIGCIWCWDGFMTYRSHCSEPAAVRWASPFIFTAAVSARTDCSSVRPHIWFPDTDKHVPSTMAVRRTSEVIGRLWSICPAHLQVCWTDTELTGFYRTWFKHWKKKVMFYLNTQSVPRSKHSVSVLQTSQLMLYREIIAVCSQIHTKHITWIIYKDPVRTSQ